MFPGSVIARTIRRIYACMAMRLPETATAPSGMNGAAAEGNNKNKILRKKARYDSL